MPRHKTALTPGTLTPEAMLGQMAVVASQEFRHVSNIYLKLISQYQNEGLTNDFNADTANDIVLLEKMNNHICAQLDNLKRDYEAHYLRSLFAVFLYLLDLEKRIDDATILATDVKNEYENLQLFQKSYKAFNDVNYHFQLLQKLLDSVNKKINDESFAAMPVQGRDSYLAAVNRSADHICQNIKSYASKLVEYELTKSQKVTKALAVFGIATLSFIVSPLIGIGMAIGFAIQERNPLYLLGILLFPITFPIILPIIAGMMLNRDIKNHYIASSFEGGLFYKFQDCMKSKLTLFGELKSTLIKYNEEIKINSISCA